MTTTTDLSHRPRRWIPWLLALACACLVGAAAEAVAAGPEPADMPPDAIVLTVLSTTDIHGHVGERHGDWLRLATVIERERKAAGGAEACLLLDSGDTGQGSMIGALSRGEVAVDLLTHLRYDAWVPGNHDLDFGVAQLAALYAKAEAGGVPVLNGNLELQGERLPSWRMLEKSGLRVAVIGMNAWYLDQWEWGDAMQGYAVEPVVPLLPRILAEIGAAKADLIVLAIHQGWGGANDGGVNEVTAIAKRFPQIDLILGGHTHRSIGGQSLYSSWYVQAGAHGDELARVRVYFDRATKRRIGIRSELLPATEEEPDAAASRAVQRWLDLASETAKGVLAETGPPVDITTTGKPGRNNAMSEIIARALAEATGAEVVLQGTHWNWTFYAGRPVTERDVFGAIAYENQVGVCELLPAELTALLNEQLTVRNDAYFSGPWGVRVEVQDGQVLRLLDRDGQPLPADQRLQVALHSYLLAGGGGRYPELRAITRRPEASLRDAGFTTREALRRYLRGAPDWSPPVPWLRMVKAPAAPKTTP